mmetsp:Transcript_29581/g.56837  ORF Transcript_29581/g.56837 Transcript_29581/m.56837 type:complete len:257 (+) Transcript_29581:93-863(+)|eukprot:CAMPEP_0114230232 /NCGR_PEP_ID=MMETSP0058-20121206/3355_1 /TAXON_ID=36894 /ORGANISM="Pyramimonas parkeae, CCMP726" /LENGTH=256 /DNA_ID=CAMNT_0001341409 /DNA_START=80 /DNA_END=850 /DNA_ORIENTATION=-
MAAVGGLETSYSPFQVVPAASTPVLSKGRRADQRFPEDFRPVFLNLGTVPSASGSAYLEFRDTKVICSVFGPRPNSKSGTSNSTEGELRVDVKFTTFASSSQRRKYTQDVEAKECQACVSSALQGVVLLDAFPKASVDLHVLVVEAQGGETAAAITCASAALAHAGIPMRDLVAGASVAYVQGDLLLDPSSLEERSADGVLTMAMMSSANEASQMFANGAWPNTRLTEAMELCMDGCAQLDELMRDQLRPSAPVLQ